MNVMNNLADLHPSQQLICPNYIYKLKKLNGKANYNFEIWRLKWERANLHQLPI